LRGGGEYGRTGTQEQAKNKQQAPQHDAPFLASDADANTDLILASAFTARPGVILTTLNLMDNVRTTCVFSHTRRSHWREAR
jgi:hypothetical protein